MSRIFRNPDHWDEPDKELAALLAVGIGYAIFVIGSFAALAVWWFSHH